MITSTMIENSVVMLLSAKYPDAHIFRREATQVRGNNPIFVVTIDLQGQTENRDFQRKDVEIIVQHLKNDRIEFNKSLNDIRDTLISELFVNSMPIIDQAKNVIKYLLVKSSSVAVVDDTLSMRMVSDFVDDIIITNPTFDLMGELHLKEEF